MHMSWIGARKAAPRSLCLVLCLLAVATSLSFGQAQEVEKATVPFSFWIGGRQLPSAEYVIEHVGSSSTLLLRTRDSKTVEQVFAIPTGSTVSADDTKLVFVMDGGRNILVEVAVLGSDQVLPAAYGAME